MNAPIFKEKDRVVVCEISDYNSRYAFQSGEVTNIFKINGKFKYGVLLDDNVNPNSRTGCFWFEPTSIERVNVFNEREEIKMFNKFTVAEVEFLDNPNTGKYAYACFDENIKEGDSVVVCTGHHGFALAKVVSMSTDESKKKEVKCGREIVCRVDFAPYNARKEAMKKAVELKRNMDVCIREAQELALYEALAETNPALKAMLDEYKTLTEKYR